jgi:ribosomal protein S24E
METKILNQIENPLFSRKEITFEIISDITPNYADTEKFIAEKFKSSADKIKINHIKGKFGIKKFIVSASIYDSKKDKDNFEITTKKQRDANKKTRIEEEKKLAEERKKTKVEAEKSTENNEGKTE